MSERQRLANATPELAVFGSAFAAILWALILLIPGESLGDTHFKFMALFGGDGIWSGAFLTMGTLQIWRLVGRTRFESPKVSIACDMCVGFVSALMWTFVTCLCLMSPWPPSPYAGSTAILAIGIWWDFLSYDIHVSAVRQKSKNSVSERKAA